jgi:type III secretion system-like peptide-binding chaperone
MSEKLWITSHVERLLADEWDVCRAYPDGDGDFPWSHGTAVGWVSVIDAGDVFMVRVWAHAAYEVKPSAKLLRELNDIQGRSLSTAIYLAGHIVVVEQTISPIGLTQPVLAQALNAVRTIADDTGVLVAGMYGGRTPLPVSATSESEDAA